MPRARHRLVTPALLLDLDALEFNLHTLAERCRRAGLDFRPHAKTHKSTRIAKLQLESGATGISVATLREAAVMVGAGIPGVLLTSPVAGTAKLDALGALAGRADGLAVVVDSLTNLKALERSLRGREVGDGGGRARRLGVLVDVDMGMHRTGVRDAAEVLALVRTLSASDVLEWRGIQAYSGNVQHVGPFRARRRVYAPQLRRLAALLMRLRRAGFAPPIVSGGGTGTFEIDRDAGLFTEVQCGSYVFMDVEYQAVRLSASGANAFRTALHVQCVVLSNNTPGWVTLDGGSKSFATDGPLPRVADRGLAAARYQFYGDEFGRLALPRPRRTLRTGTKVELVTPHCDPTVNLHDFYHCVRGPRLLDIWPVDARGPL